MNEFLKSQIEENLTKDEDALLEEWYISYLTNVNEPENIPVGTIPSAKEIFSKFEKWYLGNQEKIRDEFCEKWNTEEIKEKYIDNLELITALTELLLTMYKGIQIPGFATLTAVIISKKYLNSLCE